MLVIVFHTVSLILPDDESRVHLSLMPGVEGSDYINANYIDVSDLKYKGIKPDLIK